MARQERPVDPAAGPLQAFAHDLRKVRMEAGNPTYRVLAKAAGYSPTTLSEAANGVRQPTLDVVLAYVGACHGDVDAWRARWHELDAALRPTQTAAADGPRGVAHEELPQSPGQVWWRRRWAYGTIVGLVGVMVGAALAAFPPDGPDARPAAHPSVPAASLTGCPQLSGTATFTATTYGSGVRVRSGPARDEPVLDHIPPDCVVGLTGFCLGEKLLDGIAGTPDIRWFKVDGGGVITSALVHGNPPPDLGPSSCAGGHPAPTAIRLDTASPASTPGSLKLRATGTNVEIAGFAAYYAAHPDRPGIRRWHQIGLTDDRAPNFGVAWRLDRPARSPKTEPIPVAAVACLGGQGPTDVIDVRSVRPDGRSTALATPLRPEERSAAARAACLYPKQG